MLSSLIGNGGDADQFEYLRNAFESGGDDSDRVQSGDESCDNENDRNDDNSNTNNSNTNTSNNENEYWNNAKNRSSGYCPQHDNNNNNNNNNNNDYDKNYYNNNSNNNNNNNNNNNYYYDNNNNDNNNNNNNNNSNDNNNNYDNNNNNNNNNNKNSNNKQIAKNATHEKEQHTKKMKDSKTFTQKSADSAHFTDLIHAFQILEFSSTEVEEILQILFGILLLGNLKFSNSNNNSSKDLINYNYNCNIRNENGDLNTIKLNQHRNAYDGDCCVCVDEISINDVIVIAGLLGITPKVLIQFFTTTDYCRTKNLDNPAISACDGNDVRYRHVYHDGNGNIHKSDSNSSSDKNDVDDGGHHVYVGERRSDDANTTIKETKRNNSSSTKSNDDDDVFLRADKSVKINTSKAMNVVPNNDKGCNKIANARATPLNNRHKSILQEKVAHTYEK